MSSFDENKAAQLSLVRSSAEKFINHNRTFLSRIYPKGTRFMSSNYDPIPLWLAGCQMVALNYQAQDKPLAFNRALFRSNGQCGYILKPEPLLNDESKYNCVATTNVCKLRPVKKLRIRLISGHHLPKIAGKIKGNVIQPYVKIKIRGHLVDESEYVTEVVPKNGFNPIWESCTEFKLVYPELTFIELQVKTRPKDSDVDSKSCDDPLIGHLILPYTLLRQGYRHAYLEDEMGHRLTPACLFLHVSVIDYTKNSK